jgi:hypothetical protein
MVATAATKLKIDINTDPNKDHPSPKPQVQIQHDALEEDEKAFVHRPAKNATQQANVNLINNMTQQLENYTQAHNTTSRPIAKEKTQPLFMQHMTNELESYSQTNSDSPTATFTNQQTANDQPAPKEELAASVAKNFDLAEGTQPEDELTLSE